MRQAGVHLSPSEALTKQKIFQNDTDKIVFDRDKIVDIVLWQTELTKACSLPANKNQLIHFNQPLQTHFNGPGDQFHRVFDPQFQIDISSMGFYGIDTQINRGCDLLA